MAPWEIRGNLPPLEVLSSFDGKIIEVNCLNGGGSSPCYRKVKSDDSGEKHDEMIYNWGVRHIDLQSSVYNINKYI